MFALPALAACASAASIPATRAVWQGRTVRDEGAGTVAFSWEGTQAAFTLQSATAVSAVLSVSLVHATSFHVYVDGALTGTVDVSPSGEAKSYQLAAGLQPGAHTVVLWYIMDPIALSWPKISPGNITVSSFETDGSFGATPPALTRRLQIVGDSTMVGLTIPGDLGSAWDNAAFVPDAVLINLGTNDNARYNGTQEWVDGFVTTYAQFLVNLTVTHGNNKALPIFCTVGPITHQPVPWIRAAMEIAEGKGLTNLHFFNYTTPTDKCGHPDYVAHEVMYQQARPFVATGLGWQ